MDKVLFCPEKGGFIQGKVSCLYEKEKREEFVAAGDSKSWVVDW